MANSNNNNMYFSVIKSMVGIFTLEQKLHPSQHLSNSQPIFQGTIGFTPNSVPMVFIGVHLGILGDNLPINTHEL